MARRRYLVAYDIRDDQRLRAIHDVVTGYGDRLQYSVYLCDLDKMELLHLRADLRATMHQRDDSIVIIDLGDPQRHGSDCFEFLGAASDLPDQGPHIV